MKTIVSTTLAIYKDNVPYGYPYHSGFQTWATGSKAELKAEPVTGSILLVREVRFIMDLTLAFSAGSFHLKHSKAASGLAYTDIEIADEDEILNLADDDLQHMEFPGSAIRKKGRIVFNPPIKCRSSGDDEYFSIVDDATPLTIDAGTIMWSIVGWQMTETDYDEAT